MQEFLKTKKALLDTNTVIYLWKTGLDPKPLPDKYRNLCEYIKAADQVYMPFTMADEFYRGALECKSDDNNKHTKLINEFLDHFKIEILFPSRITTRLYAKAANKYSVLASRDIWTIALAKEYECELVTEDVRLIEQEYASAHKY